MNDRLSDNDDYRRQIVRYTQALATSNADRLRQELAAGCTVDCLKMFADDNRDKRFEKLLEQVELLRDAFDNLDALIGEYVQRTPLAAYDTGCSDADRFLRWLTATHPCDAGQRDYVTCQLSRHAVEALAASQRDAHVQFQRAWTAMTSSAISADADSKQRVLLNPIRFRAQFQSDALLDAEVTLPADVLFFPVDEQVRTAVLEPFGNTAIDELERIAPCSLDRWLTRIRPDDQDRLRELVPDLADMGLIAVL